VTLSREAGRSFSNPVTCRRHWYDIKQARPYPALLTNNERGFSVSGAAMIRFYLPGGVDSALIDFLLMPNGELKPQTASRNISLVTNIVVIVDEVGFTPAQLDIIRTFAKTQEIVVTFLPN
jgi:hypothetical protein